MAEFEDKSCPLSGQTKKQKQGGHIFPALSREIEKIQKAEIMLLKIFPFNQTFDRNGFMKHICVYIYIYFTKRQDGTIITVTKTKPECFTYYLLHEEGVLILLEMCRSQRSQNKTDEVN